MTKKIKSFQREKNFKNKIMRILIRKLLNKLFKKNSKIDCSKIQDFLQTDDKARWFVIKEWSKDFFNF